MLKPGKENTTGQNGEKKLSAIEFSPVILPGKLFFGLYKDTALKVEGGYEIDKIVLSKYLPLVSRDFADKAITLEELKMSFQHTISGSSGQGKNDQFLLELTLKLMGNQVAQLHLPLDLTEKKQPATLTDASSDPGTAQPDPVHWINIQKSAGPIYLEKIGFSCIGDDMQIALNAGLRTSALGIDLIGLSLTMPVFAMNSIEDLKVDLKGLGISFTTGAVSISGGLLRTRQNNVEEYDGALMIKAGTFTINALGSFTKINVDGQDEDSLFAFAFVDANIGGPPCFFVTGLSAGFGYNRSLKVPDITQVSSFPLLSGLDNPAALGLHGKGMPASSDLSKVLSSISAYIPPDPGKYWFAAGVKFTTFELLFSHVVLVIETGKEFEMLLLGKSFANLPQADLQYAYIELALEVVLIPDKGFFKAEAVLSQNSFLLDKACHLTGGFAFYSWFGSNEHAGDFVFTVGGYHPAFKVPSHYPAVPRVGFNWIVSSDVLIKGGAYFALTPSCMMAGGSLEALYHSGNLRAWFTAYADMLIFWKPFYFIADIGVTIGVSYHVHFLFVSKTFKLEVGADLRLYGPPTGGRVHVHLWIVSFTIHFGADENSGDHRIDWSKFSEMLPGPKDSAKSIASAASGRTLLMETGDDSLPVESEVDACHINIAGGLLNMVQDSDGISRWLVRADELNIGVESSFPSSEIKFDKYSIVPDGQSQLYIRPMQETIISSVNTITVTSKDGYSSRWNSPGKSSRDLPAAMWGKPAGSPSSVDSNDRIVPGCLVGVTNVSPASNSDFGNTGVINTSKAFGDVPLYLDGGGLPHLPLSQTAGEYKNNAEVKESSELINDGIISTASRRASILNALKTLASLPVTEEDLSKFDACTNFSGQPMVGDLAVS